MRVLPINSNSIILLICTVFFHVNVVEIAVEVGCQGRKRSTSHVRHVKRLLVYQLVFRSGDENGTSNRNRSFRRSGRFVVRF